jgi:hypothetical protein
MLANVSDYVSEKIYDQVFNRLKASYVCLNWHWVFHVFTLLFSYNTKFT